MSEVRFFNALTQQQSRYGRIVGEYQPGHSGPLLVVLAGIHGNEPSGLLGLEAVLRRLQADKPDFRGNLVGIAGNLAALAAGQRFIDEDLNRIWLPERIDALLEGREPRTSEERELREVMQLIRQRQHSGRDNFFLDLHTTSSESIPYISVPIDAGSVQWAGQFRVHTVTGGGDKLTGVSDRYLIDQGFRGFTFEAGEHHSLASVELQGAAIWVALEKAGCIAEAPPHAEAKLRRTQIDGHHYFEFEYVHYITPESGFRMKPGYVNFQRVHKGELLAWEQDKPIFSRWDARLFLPLYQKQGDDGFSIIREVDGPD